jgi:hypothetical protein
MPRQDIDMDQRFVDMEDSPQFDKSVRGTQFKIGRKSELEPYPQLHLTEEQAIVHLLSDLYDVIVTKKWNWVKKPVIDKLLMTETEKMSQRAVVPRYAGYCEVEVSNEPA